MSLLTFILLLSSSLSAAASVIYKGPGDEVVFPSGSDHGRITAITWKHNEDIAVEWYGGEPSAYRHFIGCTTLDIFTGALNISGLTRDHSGFYTAEINNRIVNTTEIRVISPVPKPTVSKQCDAKMTYCTLTCEGDTTDAEPVTYSWQIFDAHNYYECQQVNLTKENPEPWYRCEIKNPISSETSEEFPNPLSSSNQMLIIILVLSILFLLLIGLVGGIFIYRKCKYKKGSFSLVKFLISKWLESNRRTVKEDKRTDEEKTGLLEVSSNGGAVSIEETSIHIPHTSSVVPDTNTQTASNPDKTSKKPDDEPENSPKKEETQVLIHNSETSEGNHQTEISPDQVQTSEEIPESSAQTENSPKKEEETEVQDHKSETPESNTQTATDSQDQNTSSNDLQTAASTETEGSAEMSNGVETTIPLLEERDYSISVSA